MFGKILIANRGEIAVRIAQAGAAMGVETVAVAPRDDAQSLHMRRADHAVQIPGQGVRAYLDGAAIIAAAKEAGCDAIHPGYGFLSENAGFAAACAAAGLVFIGPTPDSLDLLGDKSRARALATKLGVPVLAGTNAATSLAEARAYMGGLREGEQIMLKALAGGGGRGIRVVDNLDQLESAYTTCRTEALAAFGNGDLYIERYMPRARHIEVQIAGDGTGEATHLWERECSIQRRNQKLVEIAPAPGLEADLRDALTAAALKIAKSVKYLGLGTFEFLVDTREGHEGSFAFIEANPRLQVEHTVTEEVLGLDLVQLQIRLLAGESLAEQGLLQAQVPAPKGMAMQLRINMEKIDADGEVRPAGGVLQGYSAPSGPGIRVDGFGYLGYRTSVAYDSLLAKLICHINQPDMARLAKFAARQLAEFSITGVDTNIDYLRGILTLPALGPHSLHTRFLEEHGTDVLALTQGLAKPSAENAAAPRTRQDDPLAVLEFGRETAAPKAASPAEEDESEGLVRSPMQGTVVALEAEVGTMLAKGQRVLILEAMKMQHVITAPFAGELVALSVNVDDTVFEGDALFQCLIDEDQTAVENTATQVDLDRIRPDLAELYDRRHILTDEGRPDAVAKRRRTGQRTARENVADLCDEGSFVEYGGLAIAARRSRSPEAELIEKSPADGLVMGLGTINGEDFGEDAGRCAVLSYDYTVFAGTQGMKNHQKTDRILEIALRKKLPVIFFTEGGGGRPGDTDVKGVGGLDVTTFNFFGQLNGQVPLIGVTSGRCFAGNAALLGCCDVIIATRNSSIGMGGPAMIEGGGLGIFSPEEVGPIEVQGKNGVVDIVVRDEEEAVRVAKKYLGYFQGRTSDWQVHDQRRLRHAIPENRLEAYDIREVITTLADVDSVLELRAGWAAGMITAFIRIQGRPIGVIANNPSYLGGAIDSPAADKAARFLQLCDAFGIPVLSLCDTPGMMVGPEVEKTALVRHCSRLFVTGSRLSVPQAVVVLRKAYGLGGMAMAGGTFRAPDMALSWPTGEFGGMGIEGEIKLGYRHELMQISDPAERRARFDQMVADAYLRGRAISAASYFELDDVIDPVETRDRVIAALHRNTETSGAAFLRHAQTRKGMVDTW